MVAKVDAIAGSGDADADAVAAARSFRAGTETLAVGTVLAHDRVDAMEKVAVEIEARRASWRKNWLVMGDTIVDTLATSAVNAVVMMAARAAGPRRLLEEDSFEAEKATASG